MRRGLFLLLIVLTTLRGLVGPAMAASNALPPVMPVSAAHHAVPFDAAGAAQDLVVHGGHHGETPERTEHAAHAPSGAALDCHATAWTEQAAASHHGCTGGSTAHAACADCDICHTVVLTSLAFSALPAEERNARLDLGSTRFASAAPALAIKPPIS